MTESDWGKLKVGDKLVNKRAPGNVLDVVAVQPKDRGGQFVLVKAPHGEFWIQPIRHLEFVRYLRQEEFPLDEARR